PSNAVVTALRLRKPGPPLGERQRRRDHGNWGWRAAFLTGKLPSNVQTAGGRARRGQGMAAFALEPESEHGLAVALRVDGGFRSICSCGWESAVSPVAMTALDQWADHVVTADTDRTRRRALA